MFLLIFECVAFVLVMGFVMYLVNTYGKDYVTAQFLNLANGVAFILTLIAVVCVILNALGVPMFADLPIPHPFAHRTS